MIVKRTRVTKRKKRDRNNSRMATATEPVHAAEPVRWDCSEEMIRNAFDEAWWNLGQYILWVGTRDPRAVAHAADVNSPVGPNGGSVVAAVYSETKGFTAEEREGWRGDAMRLLRSGRIKTSGIPVGETRPQDIASDELTELELRYGLGGLPGLNWREHHGITPAYNNVRVLREHVLIEFPGLFEPVKGTAGSLPPEGRFRAASADIHRYPEMKQILDSGGALSISAAARQLVENGRVAGAGTKESKITRLRRGYYEWINASNSV